MGAATACFYLVLLLGAVLGAATGCCNWVMLLGADTGCCYWLLLLGAAT